MESMKTSIGNYVTDAMTLFGLEVNTKRQLPSVMDGLKPSYRHIIYEELKYGPQFRKSVDIAGSCLSTTHGHGDQSLKDPISNLCRWGISKGQGNHGKRMLIGEDTEPSAMRYTEARISDKYLKIFSDLMPYVPYIDSEVKGTEPEYLPTVFPLCLSFGTQGIGIGVNCRMPAFTVKSMMDAMMNDNPNLLEAPFGLIIDKDKSELDLLWRTGVGKICYKFQVKEEWLEGKYGFMLTGQPELFKPNMSKLNKLVEASKIYILDQTDKTSTRIFIAREYNVKSLSNEALEKDVREASENTRTYRLTVADGNQAYLISLREWLNKTYTNYLSLIDKYKNDRINKLKFNRLVQENLKLVIDTWKLSDYNDTKQELADKLNLDIGIINAILSKSISSLSKKDTSGAIAKIDSEILAYEQIDPKQKVIEVINEF
jgi:DNA gyrase/topoisomerase IV subunit A